MSRDIDGKACKYTYDIFGKMKIVTTYERLSVGEPSKITREDGSYVTYAYDSALRLTKESYFNTTGILQNEITYSYDGSGKRISKNNQVYAYNNAYQLQTVTGSNG
ncbi:MAG: hypothetical protein ACKO96_28865, partial [Flammeovirgaceae bacterium]